MLGWEKATFRGRAAVEKERERGVRRLLTGVAAPTGASHCATSGEVLVDGDVVGTLTSGNFSPVLGARHRRGPAGT